MLSRRYTILNARKSVQSAKFLSFLCLMLNGLTLHSAQPESSEQAPLIAPEQRGDLAKRQKRAIKDLQLTFNTMYQNQRIEVELRQKNANVNNEDIALEKRLRMKIAAVELLHKRIPECKHEHEATAQKEIQKFYYDKVKIGICTIQ